MLRLYPLTSTVFIGVTLLCWSVDIAHAHFTRHAVLYVSLLCLTGCFYRSRIVVSDDGIRVITPFVCNYTLRANEIQKWVIGTTHITVTLISGQSLNIRFERGRAKMLKAKLENLHSAAGG